MGNFILLTVVLILFFELVNRIWILNVHFQNINIKIKKNNKYKIQ